MTPLLDDTPEPKPQCSLEELEAMYGAELTIGIAMARAARPAAEPAAGTDAEPMGISKAWLSLRKRAAALGIELSPTSNRGGQIQVVAIWPGLSGTFCSLDAVAAWLTGVEAGEA